MEHDVVKQPQHIEYDHFESISDFKWCMYCGGDVEFYYHGIGYSNIYFLDDFTQFFSIIHEIIQNILRIMTF